MAALAFWIHPSCSEWYSWHYLPSAASSAAFPSQLHLKPHLSDSWFISSHLQLPTFQAARHFKAEDRQILCVFYLM